MEINACLRLGLCPGHCLLNVGLRLVLGLNLFLQPLQIGLEAAKLAQEGGAVPSLRIREAARVLELAIREYGKKRRLRPEGDSSPSLN